MGGEDICTRQVYPGVFVWTDEKAMALGVEDENSRGEDVHPDRQFKYTTAPETMTTHDGTDEHTTIEAAISSTEVTVNIVMLHIVCAD